MIVLIGLKGDYKLNLENRSVEKELIWHVLSLNLFGTVIKPDRTNLDRQNDQSKFDINQLAIFLMVSFKIF